MLNYQYCSITFVKRTEKVLFGLFGNTFWKLVIKIDGNIFLETREYGEGGRDYANLHEQYNEALQQLLDDGWEIVATDFGQVKQLKKLIEPPQTDTLAATNPSNVKLLQQLASLRGAGVLTEEEFQTKKAEILKRL